MLCRILLAFVLSVVPVAAAARSERVPLALETGIGLTSDPTTFLLAMELPVGIAPDVELGPLVQLGFGDGRIIVAPTLNARYSVPVSRFVRGERPVWDRLRPLVHGGLGFAYLRNDRRRDDDDLGFLFNLGFGIQYDLTDRVSFGTRMTFNMLPGGVLDENFFLSWQLAQVRFQFYGPR